MAIQLLGETPSPQQMKFFLATQRRIAYGGARGGGKSWAARRKAVMLALNYPGLNILFLRRTLNQLTENHVRPLLAELQGIAKYNVSQKLFTFANGSRLKMGYCDLDNDVYQYQGQEYDAIFLEEATQFTEFQASYLATCNRTTRADFTPRMYYTCNPGGVGHEWVRRLFIDKRYKEGEKPEDYVFIPARVTDNKVLMERDPSYLRNLQSLPEHLRRAYLDGDWDAVEGQYFDDYNRLIHVVEPFEIPEDWKRFRAMDWGYRDPCCVLWVAIAPNRQLFVYDEIYETKVLASDMALRIRARTVNAKIAYTVASPDAWQKRGVDGVSGQTIAETFAKSHVPLMKADNNRVMGWQRIHECLAVDPDTKKPILQIFPGCRNLLRTLPTLQTSEIDHEDVSGKCEDHAPEALRYAVMSRPAPKHRIFDIAGARKKYDPLKSVDYDPDVRGEKFLKL